MKRYAWIAIASFTLGLLLAGYVFLYHTEKAPAPPDVFAKAAASAPAVGSERASALACASPRDRRRRRGWHGRCFEVLP